MEPAEINPKRAVGGSGFPQGVEVAGRSDNPDAHLATHGADGPTPGRPIACESRPDSTTLLGLKTLLRERAGELGFQGFGVVPVATPLPRRDYYLDWLAAGRHGDMAWMERNNHLRLAPENLLPGARSIVMLGVNSFQPKPVNASYRVARYAFGSDYHNFIFKRLKKLCAFLREHGGEQRPCVDTAPVMEKLLAERAGLGWQGKNTLLVHRRHGPWLLLGAIFTTLDLPSDPRAKSFCGACSRCMDACPTGALTGPGQLNANRCIAYLTIEHNGPIPVEFRAAMKDRVFGCDACLEACPWNRAEDGAIADAALLPHPLPVRLRDTFAWTEGDYAACFAGTPIKRLGLRRWLRNACVVLGNTGDAEDLPVLEKVAAGDDELLAEHAAWALARLRETTSPSHAPGAAGLAFGL